MSYTSTTSNLEKDKEIALAALGKKNKEIAKLKKQLAEKDKNLEEIQGQLALAQRSGAGEVYHLVAPALAGVRSVYTKSSQLPILCHFVKFGVAVADVGLKRATPFGSCEGLNEKLGRLAPYLDEQVISPQVNAWRSSVVALCGPAIDAAGLTVQPYATAARPYVERGVRMVEPVWRIARPIALKAVAIVQPQVEKLQEAAEEAVEKLDARVADKLDNLDAEKVYDGVEHGAEVAVAFAKEHKEDAEALIDQAASALHEVADAAAGLPAKA